MRLGVILALDSQEGFLGRVILRTMERTMTDEPERKSPHFDIDRAADLEAAFIEGARIGMSFVNLDPENRERAMLLIQGRAQSYSRR
jgi:hypothetical protein